MKVLCRFAIKNAKNIAIKVLYKQKLLTKLSKVDILLLYII